MLETERLFIRPFHMEEALRLSEYRDKPEVSRYQSWDHYSLEDAKERITDCLNHPFKGEKGNYQFAILLKQENIIIGDLFLEVIDQYRISIGYTLDIPYWSHGYASEAVKAFCIYLRDTYQYKKVIAYIYTDNHRSKALLKRLGFMKFDESYFYDDEGYIKKLSAFD